MTPEQKEKNQKYILDNLDKYVVDSRGNFVHINSDLMGSEDDGLYFIGKHGVSNWEKIVEAFTSLILRNKEDWEVVLDGSYYLENKKDGRKIDESGFGLEKGYEIAGELGYREGAWKDYEEKIELKRKSKEFERKWKEWDAQNNNIHHTLPKKEDKDQISSPSPNNNPSQTPASNESDQNNFLHDKEKNSADNLSFSLSETKNQYNSSEGKPTTDNNPNPSSNEKEQEQKLSKLITDVELLVKENNFEPQILSQLITEKENKSSAYQSLNKEGRIDKLIQQLEDIQKSQKKNNNKSVDSHENQKKANNKIPVGIIGGGIGLFILLLVAVIGIVKRRKKRK